MKKGCDYTMKEEWRDIEGFNGFYQISNTGKVASMFNTHGIKNKERKLRALSFTKDGYLKIRLVANGKDITTRVHVLVAKAFVPNPNNLATVNHKDGDKTNNNSENLEWIDRSQQMFHAYNLGLKKPIRGSKNSQAKLTDDDVRYIRKNYKRQSQEFGTVALSKKFDVSNRVIGLVTRGLSYIDVK